MTPWSVCLYSVHFIHLVNFVFFGLVLFLFSIQNKTNMYSFFFVFVDPSLLMTKIHWFLQWNKINWHLEKVRKIYLTAEFFFFLHFFSRSICKFCVDFTYKISIIRRVNWRPISAIWSLTKLMTNTFQSNFSYFEWLCDTCYYQKCEYIFQPFLRLRQTTFISFIRINRALNVWHLNKSVCC